MSAVMRGSLARRLRLLFLTVSAGLVASLIVLYLSTGSLELSLLYLNQMSIEVERRVSNDNVASTAAELTCQAPNRPSPPQGPIPKVVHFLMLSDEGSRAELRLMNYLAVKAALLNIRPDKVFVHAYELNEENPLWTEIAPHVSVVTHTRDEPLGPKGSTIGSYQIAHQADFMRLQAISRHGGIYLDTDMYALRPFDNLLTNPQDAVLGHEGTNRYGLCNGVVIARPGSTFIKRWIQGYEDFSDYWWNYYSVRLPKILATQYPNEVCALSPLSFFWPTWAKKHIRYMHDELSPTEAAEVAERIERLGGALYEEQLAYHAYGHAAWRKYTQYLTPDRIRTQDTRFNLLMRRILDAKL